MKNGVMGDITTQAKQNGYFYIDWNVDSGDSVETMYQKILLLVMY